MRKFSRWMPPLPTPETAATPATGAEAVMQLVAAMAFVAFAPWVWIGNLVVSRRLRRLAAQRRGEDIGTFARAFDRRKEPFDPWVVRATWETFEPYLRFRGGLVPLRATDRLVEDLRFAPDDLEEWLEEVAERSGHSLEESKSNPLYGRVNTVGDFVRFITLQPRLATRSSRGEPAAAHERKEGSRRSNA